MTVDKEFLDRLLKAALIRRDQWDEPPELGLVYRSTSNFLRLAPWRIPPQTWSVGHPRDFLTYISQQLTAAPASDLDDLVTGAMPPGGTALGVYFRHEGYAPPEEMAAELHARRLAGGSTPRFADIPGRREYRMIMATMFDLTERGAVQYRATPQTPPVTHSVMDGPVATALVRIAAVLAPENQE